MTANSISHVVIGVIAVAYYVACSRTREPTKIRSKSGSIILITAFLSIVIEGVA